MDILQPLRHVGKGVVDTDEIAPSVFAERDAVGHLPFEGKNKILSETLHGQRNGKAPVTADFHWFQSFDFFTGFENGGTGVVLVGQGIAPYHHSGKAVLGIRVRFQRRHIRFQTLDETFVALNFLREIFEQIVFQPELLALMVGFHEFQLGYIHVEVHLLFDPLVPCAQGLDFRVG